MEQNNNPLGYSAGDDIFIFSRSGFRKAIVDRVTPTGQVVVKVASRHVGTGWEERFKPNGGKIGNGAWEVDHVLPKVEQERRREELEQVATNNQSASRARKLVDEAGLSSAHRFAEQRDIAIAKLTEALAELRQIKFPGEG